MRKAAWITFFYALIILIGGIIGHAKAASTASLTMGIIFGILLLFSAAGMYKNHLLPAYCGILLIFILDAFFTYRWIYTFSFLPPGLLALLSLVVLVAVAILIRNDLKSQRNF